MQCAMHASNMCCLVAAECLAKDLDPKSMKGAYIGKTHYSVICYPALLVKKAHNVAIGLPVTLLPKEVSRGYLSLANWLFGSRVLSSAPSLSLNDDQLSIHLES